MFFPTNVLKLVLFGDTRPRRAAPGYSNNISTSMPTQGRYPRKAQEGGKFLSKWSQFPKVSTDHKRNYVILTVQICFKVKVNRWAADRLTMDRQLTNSLHNSRYISSIFHYRIFSKLNKDQMVKMLSFNLSKVSVKEGCKYELFIP